MLCFTAQEFCGFHMPQMLKFVWIIFVQLSRLGGCIIMMQDMTIATCSLYIPTFWPVSGEWNSRFLQGPDTDKADVARIREALSEGRSFCGRLLNYKKDGTKFWNLLTITPIKDEDGKILKFIGSVNISISKCKWPAFNSELVLIYTYIPSEFHVFPDRSQHTANDLFNIDTTHKSIFWVLQLYNTENKRLRW